LKGLLSGFHYSISNKLFPLQYLVRINKTLGQYLASNSKAIVTRAQFLLNEQTILVGQQQEADADQQETTIHTNNPF
jgi:hypothetical protein